MAVKRWIDEMLDGFASSVNEMRDSIIEVRHSITQVRDSITEMRDSIDGLRITSQALKAILSNCDRTLKYLSLDKRLRLLV